MCEVLSLDGPADLTGSLVAHIGNAARRSARRTSGPAHVVPDAAVRGRGVRRRCGSLGLLKSQETRSAAMAGTTPLTIGADVSCTSGVSGK
jgi:hypothetical protein